MNQSSPSKIKSLCHVSLVSLLNLKQKQNLGYIVFVEDTLLFEFPFNISSRPNSTDHSAGHSRGHSYESEFLSVHLQVSLQSLLCCLQMRVLEYGGLPY